LENNFFDPKITKKKAKKKKKAILKLNRIKTHNNRLVMLINSIYKGRGG
jgi:hypothetical protein